ncbi:MAG: MFS transporter [Alphaproteobacteria bacterium]|nr:MFS transporter [Alphaproteobacteria bacterium]
MGVLSSLSREQKEAVGLLQIGTFLEYFDLMLYVHMAVLLNELFFPKTDAHTAALLSAFAFCSTFVLRPFGALIFGYIGDNIGRKTTVIITTMMMSSSCVIMANLPTYAEVGITAAWIVTGCRIAQGLSSMGEIMGAQVYMTEITKPPIQYPAVSFISVAAAFGALAALGMACLVTSVGFNWRIAFWLGAAIAVVGSIARTRLRETPEFIEKINKKQLRSLNKIDEQKKQSLDLLENEKAPKKTLLAFFLIYCGWPLCFYLVYMYFNPTLKAIGYSSSQIIYHNFLLAIIHVVSCLFFSILSHKVYPLKISKIRGYFFFFIIILLPFITNNASNSYQIFLLQTLILLGALGDYPAVGIFIKHIPVLKRVTATSFLYAATRAIMYIITTFSLVYLTEWFGHFGLWLITIPVTVSFFWGINHFEKLEQEKGIIPKRKGKSISDIKENSKLVA